MSLLPLEQLSDEELWTLLALAKDRYGSVCGGERLTSQAVFEAYRRKWFTLPGWEEWPTVESKRRA